MSDTRRDTLIDDIERALTGSSDLHIGRVAACRLSDAKEGTGDLAILAEFAADRVNDSDAIDQAVRLRLRQTWGLTENPVEILRPGWLATDAAGEIMRWECRAKYLEMLKRRQSPGLARTDLADTLDEDEKDCFRRFGAQSKIRMPCWITHPGRIAIGSWVSLGRFGKILMQTDFSSTIPMIRQHYPETSIDFDQTIFGTRTPTLKIGDGTSIGDQFFINCALSIDIGRHVLISDRLFISDNNHRYDHPELPIILQSNTIGRPVVIEDHAWIGINVVILEGVRIGRHAVIGAGSVVTRDVPPYTVAAGVPARVIKAIPYDHPSPWAPAGDP